MKGAHFHPKSKTKLRDSELTAQIHYRLIESLRTSEDRYRNLVESLQSIVFHIDESGCLCFLNKAWSSLLGYSSTACLGRPLVDFAHESDRAEFESYLQGDRPQDSLEFRVLDNTGRIHWVALVRGLRGADGSLVGSMRDVTSKREAEHMRADFMASVSHELRTPLTSILGFAQALQRNEQIEPDDRRQFLGIIADQARRLKSLVNGLIDLTRIDAGEFGCDLQLHSPWAFLNRYAADYDPLCKTAEIHFESQIGPETDCGIKLDPDRFAMALNNLLSNAIKFSSAGTTIKLTANVVAEEIVITITDQGIGIPEEHLTQVFDRFFRVPRPGHQIPGTGFGLAITKEIVNSHGGSISVCSRADNGSTFTISLPIAE